MSVPERKKDLKQKSVSIRMDDLEFRQYRTLCYREETSMSQVTLRAIRGEIVKLKKKYPDALK
jgi:hypothetical protein